jgi:hypothetical protein
MRKILLILALIGGTTLTTLAQKASVGKFSLGLEVGKTVGSYSNYTDITYGLSLKYNHPLADKLFFTASAGYTYVPYNNEYKIGVLGFNIDSSGEGFIPVKAGVKHFFNNSLYAEAQLGAAISTNNGGGVGFAYAPGIGVEFGGADIVIRYEGWAKGSNTLSQLALRIGYSF